MSKLMLAVQSDLAAGASDAAIAQTAAFQTLDVRLIAAAERRFTSVAFERWAEQLGTKVRDDLAQVLLNSWLAGDGPEAIQREIRKVSSVGITRARLIARTETLNTQRSALQQLYQDADQVQGWQWYSTRDSRTCPICWTLDGRRFTSQNGTVPEMQTHPNCRCTMLPLTPDLDDIVDDTVTVPENGSYPPGESPSDRLEKLSDEDRERIFGSGRAELLKSNRATPEDLVIAGPPARLRTLPELAELEKASRGMSLDDQIKLVTEWQSENYSTKFGMIDLRDGTELSEDQAKRVAALDQLIAQQPPLEEAITVFRGSNYRFQFEDVSRGDVITDGAYVATAEFRWAAETFIRRDRPDLAVMIEIELPAGTRALRTSELGTRRLGEGEILLPRGSRFKVISRPKDGKRVKLRLIL
jgi:SPP1 gp7 family putative phage head morphogenesis protein